MDSSKSFRQCVPLCRHALIPEDSKNLCSGFSLFLSAPHGLRPAAAEAVRWLHSLGSQFELAEQFRKFMSNSQVPQASLSDLLDLEACSADFSDPAESMLLVQSSSEEIDNISL